MDLDTSSKVTKKSNISEVIITQHINENLNCKSWGIHLNCMSRRNHWVIAHLPMFSSQMWIFQKSNSSNQEGGKQQKQDQLSKIEMWDKKIFTFWTKSNDLVAMASIPLKKHLRNPTLHVALPHLRLIEVPSKNNLKMNVWWKWSYQIIANQKTASYLQIFVKKYTSLVNKIVINTGWKKPLWRQM